MAFPENAYTIGSRGFRIPSGAFSILSPKDIFAKLAHYLNPHHKARKEERNMSRSKIVRMTLIVFAMASFLVGEAVAGESGKVVEREVYYVTTVHRLNVPDVEGHINSLTEAKAINFNEKFGNSIGYLTQLADGIKGIGTVQGYTQITYPDGSTITSKWMGEMKGAGLGPTGGSGAKGTWSYIKGTGKYEGIKGQGTYDSYVLGPGQWYSEVRGEYTLP